MLTTPEQVIHRAAIEARPEYEDIGPMKDAPGFYAFRRYPPGSELTKIVTADGRPAVRCYLSFTIAPPAEGSHISLVDVRSWMARRWRPSMVISSSGDPYDPPQGHPDAPTATSAAILARTRKPINLDNTDVDASIYDCREDVFLDEKGRKVTPIQILDELYEKHCRTLRLAFRIRWNIGSAARWLIREATWKSQDIAMWALLTFYEVEVIDDEKKLNRFSFFHKYKPSDFRRVAEKDGERSHFFGFQSSTKNLFTNLTVVAIACLALYLWGPRAGLLRAVYNNTALTTAALVFGFLLADTVGPWFLIRMICVASRFRDRVLFFIRKVSV